MFSHIYEIVAAFWIASGLGLWVYWKFVNQEKGPFVPDAPQRTLPGALLWPVFLLLSVLNAIWVTIKVIIDFGLRK